MNWTKTVIAVFATIVGQPVAAGDLCAKYVDTTVKPLTFGEAETALGRLKKIPPKGEFETTAQYQARRASALGNVPASSLIIAKQPEDRSFFEYDADQQKLRIKSFAFDNTNFDTFHAFTSAGYYGKIDVSDESNFDILIATTEKSTGSYVATNAFGVAVRVTRVQSDVQAIFDRSAFLQDSNVFPAAASSPAGVIGELSLSPKQAQALKPNLRIAFVVRPKEPYLVNSFYHAGAPTIDDPRDITEHFSIIVADIQCGLVMDAHNKVLGSYPAISEEAEESALQ